MTESDFLDRYGRWAAIAGGSEGVGSALAHRLAERGFDLLLVARKPDPLEETARNIRQRHDSQVVTLSADLTAPDGAERVVEAAKGCDVGLLICNAGAESLSRHFLDRPLADAERMVMLNILTPLRLIAQFAPAMVKRGHGAIVLCSSLASLAGTPGLAAYSGAKAFINLFVESLWGEWIGNGVDVSSAILPLVRTPAAKRMGLQFDNDQKGVDPDDIADEILANIGKGPAVQPGGSQDIAMRLRSLPRNEAVRLIVGLSKSANSDPRRD